MNPKANITTEKYIQLLEQSLQVYALERIDETYNAYQEILGAWEVNQSQELKWQLDKARWLLISGYDPISITVELGVLSNVTHVIASYRSYLR